MSDRASRQVVNNNNIKNQSGKFALHQSQFVMLSLSPQNAEKYKYKVTLAKVIEDVTLKDTTDPRTSFQVQIFCTFNITDFCKKGNKMYPWKGLDNVLWKPFVRRDNVLHVLSEGLTSKKHLTKHMRAIVQEYL